MKRLLTTMMIVMFSLAIFAQNYTVNFSGTVFDEDSNEPLFDHPVFIFTDSTSGNSGYYNMLLTDADGTFADSFDVPIGESGVMYVSVPNCDGSDVYATGEFSENNNDLTFAFLVCSDSTGNDECYASFYGNPQGNDGLTMQFTDASWGDPTSWLWDFGDNESSTEQNPLHTFPEIGQYYVSLTIENPATDCLNTVEMCIYVGDTIYYPDSCMAWFYGYPDQEEYMTMNFIDMSIADGNMPPDSWSWSFGDGETSEEQNPVHTYTEEGQYEVCLTIATDDGSCTSTYCEYIYIEDWDEYCEAMFYYYPMMDSVPSGDDFAIQFMDYSFGNPDTWMWEFGDGTSSNEQNPMHIYDSEGMYDVCLTISNETDSCFSTICQEVYVFNDSTNDCFGWFSYEIDDLMVDFEGYLDNSQQGDYEWDFGDGTSGEGESISHEYAEDGIYYVTMTVVDSLSDCYTTYTEVLFVGDNIPFDIGGYVYLVDSMMADAATVYLMTFDTIGEELINVAETEIDENGYYLFEEVSSENCIYFVQADLTEVSDYYGDYAPTYHYNALNWMDAYPVFIFMQDYPVNIYMLENETNSMGEGVINGTVNNDEVRDQMGDVEILLLNEAGAPLTYMMTNAEGEFDFSNLDYGTYIVHTEIVGIETTPVTVVLSENSPTATINIVVTNGEAILGIEFHSAYVEQVGDIYPNPAVNDASINVVAKEQSEIRLAVSNSFGQIIYQVEEKINTGTQRFDLNTNQLPKGLYFVTISTKDGAVMVKKLVKL